MQAIGYKEVIAHLRNQQNLIDTKAAINLATLQYAKRQRTWFRKEPEVKVFNKSSDAGLEICSAL